MASGGTGTSEHVSGELFKMMAGINMIHVPYRSGGLAVTDLLGAQVQVLFSNMLTAIEHIKSGMLRALAITTAARSQALPDTPTVGESVPGYEASNWWGVGAPKNVSPEIIEKLNKEISTVVADPNVKSRLVGLGVSPMSMTSAEFGKLIADETENWSKVIEFAGIKPE